MGKEAAQCHKDIAFLFAAGGNHRLQAGIHHCSSVGAKVDIFRVSGNAIREHLTYARR